MVTPTNDNKIILNFGWTGPSTCNGGWQNDGLDVRVVDLIFKNAKTDISVNIPENISPTRVQKLPFTCRKYQETEITLNHRKFKPLASETHPDFLKVSIEQIQNLKIKAGFFEESPNQGPSIMDRSGKITREKRVLRSDSEVKLEIPKDLEVGQSYTLVITSDDLSLSASLQKKEETNSPNEPNKANEDNRANKDEFKNRMKKMGEALISEGIQNLKLASRGGAGVFDSTSTEADVFAHAMQGVIRSGQQMHPEISVPYTKPSESSSDLNTLSRNQLQKRFEETYLKDKEFESQRMKAAIAGNIEEMNRIMKLEHENSQLLINLAQALERKGIQPQIPQYPSFQTAANESATAHTEALKNVAEHCKMQ